MSLSKIQTKPEKNKFCKRFDSKRELAVKFLIKNKIHKIDVKAENTEFLTDIYRD